MVNIQEAIKIIHITSEYNIILHVADPVRYGSKPLPEPMGLFPDT